jgi:RNA polymerase sigma-70 factor (ECF subfamily)
MPKGDALRLKSWCATSTNCFQSRLPLSATERSRSSAKDLHQIYFSLAKFDLRRPFFPWLYRIAINQCYDELRRIRRQRTHTFSELSLDDTGSIEKLISQNNVPASPDEDRHELQVLLRKMLNQLPDQQRLAIVLRDLEVIPYSKIAETLRCTEQAARLKVFRARARLKTLMERAMKK